MSARDKFQRLLILVLISIIFFYGGFYFGKRGYDVEIKKNPPEVKILNKNIGDKTIDFALFWEVWNLVNRDYLERPIDPQIMLYGAMKGVVDSLGDPYSAFLPPDMNEAVNDSINSSYQGIGAELALRENQLIIVAPLDGSPAKEMGIRAGDVIYEIEGESTAGITVTEAVLKIRGDAGTTITLLIGREGEEPKEYRITRGVIKVDSVVWEDKGDGTAYIRISRFGQETDNEWDNVVKAISEQMTQLDAIILDLRGNPGGYMMSPVYIAGDFFSNKVVVIQQSATGSETPLKSPKKNGAFEDIPRVFILIDEGSASASEILAAAMKDNFDAVLVGMKSFGKGTIQDARDFKDGSGIHITTGKWLTPSKEWVHKVGIEPDVKVEVTKEDIEGGIDPQLNKALELAKEI